MRTTFIHVLTEAAAADDRIFLLTPDLGFSVFEQFQAQFPDRFLNTGIAEQNTISVASGLALSGFKPYVYSIGPFAIMRCYEQVRDDVAYMNTNVKIVGAGAGFAYGPAGTTHHMIEDFALTKVLPNMTVCSPADPIEARQIFEQSLLSENAGPMWVRIARNKEPLVHNSSDIITLGKAAEITKGENIQLLTTGTITYRMKDWVEHFSAQGFSCGLTTFPTIKPLDTDYLDSLIASKKAIIITEEHNTIGGLAESICAYLGKKNATNKIICFGIDDQYSHYIGDQNFNLQKFGLYDIPDIKTLLSN